MSQTTVSEPMHRNIQPMAAPAKTDASTGKGPDFVAIKTRQQATWASGDYSIVGTTLQIVGESLCEALDLRAGERVLDVACGNGNAALAAARRFADVTGVDYVPSLMERAKARAEAEGLTLTLREGDAEQLPFADANFDVVLSTFGVMFAPDQARAAKELVRVCRPGGRIGLANWTPEGFIGQLFRTVGKHLPPPAGLQSPVRWGTEQGLTDLFAGAAAKIEIQKREFVFRYESVAHWMDVFRRYYGPVHKAFEALDANRQVELARDIEALIDRFKRGGKGLALPSEYLEAIIHTK